jgi:Domain of unknown function (DUF4328)
LLEGTALRKISSSADSGRVEAHQQAFGHGTHRVVDPADQPRDLTGLAWCVYVSFGLLAVLVLLRILAAIHLHGLANGGGNIEGGYRDFFRWIGIYSLLLLVCAGIFIAWFFQAYKNLRRLGVANLRYGNGWAIGGWFVPILGMWRPKQIANDVWRGSEPGAEISSGWKAVTVPTFLHWWWGLFLAQGVLLYVGQEATRSGYRRLHEFGGLSDGFGHIRTGTTIDIIGSLLALAGIGVAIHVVNRITEREEQLRAAAPPAYYPPAPAYPQAPQYPPAPPQTQVPAYPPPAQYAQSPSYPPPAAPVPSAAPQAAPPQAAPPPPPPAPQPDAEQRIQCPECAEWIQAQANVCRFCGHRLRPLGQ